MNAAMTGRRMGGPGNDESPGGGEKSMTATWKIRKDAEERFTLEVNVESRARPAWAVTWEGEIKQDGKGRATVTDMKATEIRGKETSPEDERANSLAINGGHGIIVIAYGDASSPSVRETVRRVADRCVRQSEELGRFLEREKNVLERSRKIREELEELAGKDFREVGEE